MRNDSVYLRHILDAIHWIFEFTAEGESTFFADRKTRDAVVKNLEIIGEAAKNILSRLRDTHPDIPWKQIAGMRDKLIHQYFGANQSLVYEVVRRDLPDLEEKIKALLRKLEVEQ